MSRRVLKIVLLISSLSVAVAQQPEVEERLESLIARMTLVEKLGQLTQFTPDQPEFAPAAKQGLVGAMLGIRDAAHANEMHRMVLAGSRLKIPLLLGHDVIHGYKTIFPIPLAIAASWDPPSAELSAQIGAREARAGGIRWTFAPMVDIARDPRWGRIAEGAGEDPFLGSAMAAAYVRGFQGEKLLACAKHFVAYGAPEGGRDYDSVDMSEARLREVYLPPFKAAVDAGVASFMTGFDSLNGIPATANRRLLDEILRKEWGFSGFVVSDWTSIDELRKHGVAATKQDAAIKAIAAGVDMDMVADAYTTLAEAVRSGRLAESTVNESVRRVLRAKARAGVLDDPFAPEKKVVVTREHRELARRVAQKSIVLLKNEGSLLPIAKSSGSIAVIGPLAEAKEDMLGPWAAEGKGEDAVSVLEGLRAVHSRIVHAKGSGVLEGTDQQLREAVEIARQADTIVAVLGELRDMSGEAASRASLDLPGRQQELLESLVATGKPVVLIVMAGRPLTISRAVEKVPAILYAWFLGTEGGKAVADVLFGDVNPGGKLPVTFPRAVGQVPIYYSHLPTGRPFDAESKYTNKYIDAPITPLFPFGFGLSYTRFEYRNLQVSSSSASAEVINAGSRAGDEIVQFYIADPVASVSRPVKELKGFQRISLRPGESRRIEFPITRDALQFWSEKGWIVEPGTFKVWIGPDSTRGLEGSFELR